MAVGGSPVLGQRLVTYGFWTFDVVTVIIWAADVTSDVLVAKHFRDSGHQMWCWLVIGLYLPVSVLMTLDFVRRIVLPPRIQFAWSRIPLAVRYMVTFAFAPLIPLLHWLLITTTNFDTSSPPSIGIAAAANVPEQEEKKEESPFHHALESVWVEGDIMGGCVSQKLSRLWGKHELFLVETIVKIVQCVIQLLAIWWLGEPSSPVQVWSIGIAFVSVASKGYVVANALDLGVVVFNWAAVVFDLSTLLYVLSPVFLAGPSRNRGLRVPDWVVNVIDHEGAGGLELHVSVWWAAWVIKTCLVSGCLVFAAAIFFIGPRIYKGKEDASTASGPQRASSGLLSLRCLGGFFVACCLLSATLLLPEVLKLTIFICITAPGYDSLRCRFSDDQIALICSFIMQSADSTEATRRVKHLMNQVISADLGVPCARQWFAATQKAFVVEDSITYMVRNFPRRGITDEAWETRYRQHGMTLLLAIPEASFEPWMLDSASFWHTSTLAPPATGAGKWWAAAMQGMKHGLTWEQWLTIILCGIPAIHAVFGAIFPFVHLWLAAGDANAQNACQVICVATSIGSTAIVLLLAPRVMRYRLIRKRLSRFFGLANGTPAKQGLLSWIQTYYYPTAAQVLVEAVPEAVLPRDVVVHSLAIWFSPTDVPVDRSLITAARGSV